MPASQIVRDALASHLSKGRKRARSMRSNTPTTEIIVDADGGQDCDAGAAHEASGVRVVANATAFEGLRRRHRVLDKAAIRSMRSLTSWTQQVETCDGSHPMSVRRRARMHPVTTSARSIGIRHIVGWAGNRYMHRVLRRTKLGRLKSCVSHSCRVRGRLLAFRAAETSH